LRGAVAEQDLPRLAVGQKATVQLSGMARAFEGKVRLLGAVIDPQTRLGSVRIELTPDPNLRPGAFARAEVVVSREQRATLPQTAVLADARGSYVLLVGQDNRVSRRAVEVSGTAEGGLLISKGLQGHEKVVATAGAFLQEGEVVKTTRPSEKS
jgi:HlyD family secretion protein